MPHCSSMQTTREDNIASLLNQSNSNKRGQQAPPTKALMLNFNPLEVSKQGKVHDRCCMSWPKKIAWL